MKTLVLGVLLGLGLVMAAAGLMPERGEAFAQRVPPYRTASAEGELIALSTTVGDKYQQLTVIDPKLKVLSVYHVDLASGNVELKCVRTIHWDLQMTYYNGKGPLPQDIQSLLEATR
ncbi:MAG: hypothetical protein HUU20_09805 [Pirellulales bacterium]|nr:hypothetical protein [Pirellulales bacterium]